MFESVIQWLTLQVQLFKLSRNDLENRQHIGMSSTYVGHAHVTVHTKQENICIEGIRINEEKKINKGNGFCVVL